MHAGNSRNRVEFVVRKYRLDAQSFIEQKEEGEVLGDGRLMALDTLERFKANDPSGNFKYLDWMLFQAGGGQKAMERSLALWEGSKPNDLNSLRNLYREDFIAEHTGHGLTQAQAIEVWKQSEKQSRHEFVMGDQDVAFEGGFGFYRNWPGRCGLYAKIVNAVKLWHSAQPKLLAQNQQHARYSRLQGSPAALWSKGDYVFMLKYADGPLPVPVNLDIYAGWKPNEYSQATAVYVSLDSLLSALSGMRCAQVLKDVRFDRIYEDAQVLVVCPLTIGASLKFGIDKWCSSNLTEVKRAFSERNDAGNWQHYLAKGPLVYMTWKVPMPLKLQHIALHIPTRKLKEFKEATDAAWVDSENRPEGTNYAEVTDSILRQSALSGADVGKVMASLGCALLAIKRWGATFDPQRVVIDYLRSSSDGEDAQGLLLL